MNKILLPFFLFALFSVWGQKITGKHDQELSIVVKEGTLYGSLLVPKSKGKLPVVLLIPGSGPTDRDCNSSVGLNSNAFLLLAEALYKEGIATLRIDKRASGKSLPTFAGSLDSIRFEYFIDDVEKWIDMLKRDARFSEVIVAGHSQGSLVGMVASGNRKVDKFISLAGAGRTIDEVLNDQLLVSFPKFEDTIAMFLDSIKAGSYMDNAPALLKQTLPKQLNLFLQQWMSYSPEVHIALLDCPVLIVNGENDIQVSVNEAEILHQASPKSKLVLIPEMNHVLKNAPPDRLSNLLTYNQPSLPLNTVLINEMVRFVRE